MSTVIGVDAQPISEVAASLEEFGVRYIERLFTRREVDYCEQNAVTASSCFAEQFAAKEAVLKILDLRNAVPSWRDIEVDRTSNGKPAIVLHGVAATLAREQKIRQISLSIDRGGGVAFAVAIGHVD